jgi:hypothetical protein
MAPQALDPSPGFFYCLNVRAPKEGKRHQKYLTDSMAIFTTQRNERAFDVVFKSAVET